MILPTKEELKQITLNFLTFFLLLEGAIMVYEVFVHGYTMKAFFYLGMILLGKLSQIFAVIYYDKK